MMTYRRKILTLLTLMLMSFSLIACSTGRDSRDTTTLEEEVVAAAVATIQAQQPANTTSPINYSSSVGDIAGLEAVLTNLYQTANPSVVYIVVPNLGSGSGFIYSVDGYIVTNNHVVAGGSGYQVVFSTGEQMYAELIGRDEDSDLAVLKVASIPTGVAPLRLASAESIAVGQFVVAIGSPFGEQGSMSLGIISGLGRSLTSQRESGSGGTYSLPNVIQTDAPINPGNSGGPLLNLAGEVVGINSAIATTTGTNSGVGFAIPVEAIAKIVPSLIENGVHEYSYLGLSFDNEVSIDELDIYGLSQTQGAYVLNVSLDGPAANAGIRGANQQTGEGGDLIIQIDNEPIRHFADLNNYLVFHTSPGQTIQLTVLRDGEQQIIPITLAARP